MKVYTVLIKRYRKIYIYLRGYDYQKINDLQDILYVKYFLVNYSFFDIFILLLCKKKKSYNSI